MATVNDTQNELELELEAMRKEDCSWHPCRVSLRSSGNGLSVDFGNQELGVMFLDKEDVLTHLRFRSIPLKADDCSSIKEGDHVLATDKSELGSLFYDAKVAKVLRVRHNRGPCRCMFTIKWLHQDFEDGIIVPLSSIRKLTMKDISDYPTVAIVLQSVKHMNSSISSPFLIGDISCDLGLSKLLEEQIKDISSSAGAIKKEIPMGSLVKIEAKISIAHANVVSNRSPSRRTTRSSSNLPVDAKIEDSLVNSSMKQEIPEIKSRLSPLAACAALASRVQINPNYVTINGISASDPAMSNNLLVKDNLSEDVLTTPFPAVLKSVKMVKPQLSSQSTASRNSHLTEFSSRRTEHEAIEFADSSTEDRTLEFISATTQAASTRRKLKLNQPPNATRITGSASAMQNDGGTSIDFADMKNCAEELKLRASTNGKRLTRSAFKNKQENVDLELNAKSSPITVSGTSTQILEVDESNDTGFSKDCVQKKASSDDLNLSASTNGKRLTRSAFKNKRENVDLELKVKSSPITVSGTSTQILEVDESNGTGFSKDSVQRKASADDLNLSASTNGKRFTRSALSQQKENLTADIKDDSSLITPSGSSEKKFVISESNDTRIFTDETRTSADINLSPPTSRKRVTRSALQQERKFLAPELDFKSNCEPEFNYSEGQGTVSKKSKYRVKGMERDSLQLDAGIHNQTLEGSNEQRCTAFQTNQQTEGRNLGNNTHVQGQKKKCSSTNKQQQRFSPRNFPPRTRSQGKSA